VSRFQAQRRERNFDELKGYIRWRRCCFLGSELSFRNCSSLLPPSIAGVGRDGPSSNGERAPTTAAPLGATRYQS